jgi:FkbM family methyltransferase
MTWKQHIVSIIKKMGYDLSRYRPGKHPEARRMRLMQEFQIDLVLDVGANAGQYGSGLRSAGFKERIVSFEPLSAAFNALQLASTRDPKWEVKNTALGAQGGTQAMHVAANSTSSSLLDMLPSHKEAAPQSRYIGKESIEVQTIDSLSSDLMIDGSSVWLKIDTQGYELEVLKGAEQTLEKIDTIQMEVSMIPLYEGSPDFAEVLEKMKALGYTVISIEPGFSDPRSGRMLQADFTFHRYLDIHH